MRDVADKLKDRLLVVLNTVQGVKKVYDDAADIPPVDVETKVDLLPAVVMLEGKEIPKVGLPIMAYSQQSPARPFWWFPEVWIALKPRGTALNVGVRKELTGFRQKIITAVMGDDSLRLLCGDNGGIDYRGYETDMQSGGECVGQMRLDFVFTYMLDLDDLVA